MPRGSGLKSVLSHLKSKALKLDLSEPQPVLSALLLMVAGGEDDYALANALAPAAVRNALPFPSPADFAIAAQLLNMPPHLVRTLDPCILSYLYQFFCAPQREAARRQLQSPGKKAGAEETISFTQLYTPTNVVDYLLSQTLAVGSGDCGSMIDPSCGAGTFLWRTFDLLLLQLVSAGWTKEAAADHILKNILHGCDIDPIALWITCLGLAVRCRNHGIIPSSQLNLACVAPGAPASCGHPDKGAPASCRHPDKGAPASCRHREPVLGTLSRDWPTPHLLDSRFDAVVGNPPYLGRKLLDRDLKDALRKSYPEAHHDLCSAFLLRGLELLKPSGRLGYITQSSMLYLPSYAKLRKRILTDYQLMSVVEAGPRVFPLQSGEKVCSMMLVIENSAPQPGVHASFSDLTDCTETSFPAELSCLDQSGRVLKLDPSRFLDQPNNAFNYRCPSALNIIRKESGKLSELADIRQGLATGDNKRFIKWWWQIDPVLLNNGFFPYVKGGGSERWYCPIETVIDWRDDGAAIKQSVSDRYAYLNGKTHWVVKNERFYFREGLTFSLVNTKQLSVRVLPPGCIFDVAGSALFTSAEDRAWLLAYLNSSFCAASALMLNPTINYQVGDLKELPVVPFSPRTKDRLTYLSDECVRLKKGLYRFSETDKNVCLPDLRELSFRSAWDQLDRERTLLGERETEIDELVLQEISQLFTLDREQRSSLTRLCERSAERRKPIQSPFSQEDEFHRLILRLMLYRQSAGPLNEELLRRRLGPLSAAFFSSSGIRDYIIQTFELDQRDNLHGSLRVRPELHGDDVILVLPGPDAAQPQATEDC
jgi:hypothetical protein